MVTDPIKHPPPGESSSGKVSLCPVQAWSVWGQWMQCSNNAFPLWAQPESVVSPEFVMLWLPNVVTPAFLWTNVPSLIKVHNSLLKGSGCSVLLFLLSYRVRVYWMVIFSHGNRHLLFGITREFIIFFTYSLFYNQCKCSNRPALDKWEALSANSCALCNKAQI